MSSERYLDFSKLRYFANLTEELKKIEAREKVIKEEIAELEPLLIDQMAECGVNKTNINGRTYYIRRDLYAGPEQGLDKGNIVVALKESGMGAYVSETYNSNSLSAFVRSLKNEAEGGDLLSVDDIKAMLPKPLQEVMRVGENFKLASRKG